MNGLMHNYFVVCIIAVQSLPPKGSPGITSYLIPLAVVFLVLVVSGFLCKLVQVYRSDKRYWMLRHRYSVATSIGVSQLGPVYLSIYIYL